MAITVGEKNYWKERIERRVDRAIDELLVANDPTFKTRIAIEARKRAIQALEIEEPFNRTREIDKQIQELLDARSSSYRKMAVLLDYLARLPTYFGSTEHFIAKAIDDRQSLYEIELMNESVLGNQIQQLIQKKEELIDASMLATSTSQIATLWSRITSLFGDSETEVEADNE